MKEATSLKIKYHVRVLLRAARAAYASIAQSTAQASVGRPTLGPVLLALSAAVLGSALEESRGLYSTVGVGLVGVALALAWLSVLRTSRVRLPARSLEATLTAGVLANVLLQVRDATALAPPLAFAVLLAASTLVALCFLGDRWARLGLVVAVVAFVALGELAILHAPNPHIDVVVNVKAGCDALAVGVNPYTITFPLIYSPGETELFYARDYVANGRVLHGYAYPPLTLLLGCGSQIVLGDFRHGNLLAMAGAALLVGLLRRGSFAPLSAMLFLSTPVAFFFVENGWMDPIAMLLLALVLFASVRKVRILPYAVGLFLVSKQYAIVVAPMALLLGPRPRLGPAGRRFAAKALVTGGLASLPLALWNLPAFWRSTIQVQIDKPFRYDSLNFAALWYRWTHGVPPPTRLAFAALAGATIGLLPRLSRDAAGFALGLALALSSYWAFASGAFCNYYVFIVFTLCGAIAAGSFDTEQATTAETARPPPRVVRTALTRAWSAVARVPPWLLPVALFLVVTVPYWNQAPMLDPLLSYNQAIEVNLGHWRELYGAAGSAHPPLLFVWVSLFFRLMGESPLSFRMAGFVAFAIGALSFDAAMKGLVGPLHRVLFVALLFCSPMAICNYFDLTHDPLIVTTFGVALLLFVRERWIGFALSLGFFALGKETGLLAVPAFVVAWALVPREGGTGRRWVRLALCLLPVVITFVAWRVVLAALGGSEWNDVSGAPGEGGFEFGLRNLLPSQLFSQYLLRNLYLLFVFNFHWVYTLLAVVLAARIPWRKAVAHTQFRRVLVVLASFSILYVLFALSYHTWTLPGYGLPVFAGLSFVVAWGLASIRRDAVRSLLVVGLASVVLVANCESVDPLSVSMGTTQVHGERFYQSVESDGRDGIFYNQAFLRAERRQNDQIAQARRQGAQAIASDDCWDFAEKLKYQCAHPEYYPGDNDDCLACLDAANLLAIPQQRRLGRVYVPRSGSEGIAPLLLPPSYASNSGGFTLIQGSE
jgi:hypothetical protein